jgi:hypothetical protein
MILCCRWILFVLFGCVTLPIKDSFADNDFDDAAPRIYWLLNKMKDRFFRTIARRMIEIPCAAESEGFHRPQTRWLKDGIDFDPTLRGTNRTTLKRRFLRLSDLEISDSGKYTCIAYNDAYMIQWNYTVEVIRDNPPMPSRIVSEMKNYTAYVGDNVTLECHVMSTYLPSIQWVKHYKVNGSWTGENKRQTARIIKHSGPEVVDPSYLVLTNVTMDDATRYSCIVSDQNSEQSSIYHWLIVKPRPKEPPPMIVEVPVQVPVHVETPFIHSCKFKVLVGAMGVILVAIMVSLSVMGWCWWRRGAREVYDYEDEVIPVDTTNNGVTATSSFGVLAKTRGSENQYSSMSSLADSSPESPKCPSPRSVAPPHPLPLVSRWVSTQSVSRSRLTLTSPPPPPPPATTSFFETTL